MLTIPDARDHIRLIGIDPGSHTLGVAYVHYNLATKQLYVKNAVTVTADKIVSLMSSDVVLVHGERRSRLIALQSFLLSYFDYTEPDVITSESPFLGMRVTAFETLTECCCAIREAVYQYKANKPLVMVSPTEAKKAVGVKGKGTTKDDVRNGVLAIPNIVFDATVDVNLLDEHAIDAIAVAYSKCKEWYSQLPR